MKLFPWMSALLAVIAFNTTPVSCQTLSPIDRPPILINADEQGNLDFAIDFAKKRNGIVLLPVERTPRATYILPGATRPPTILVPGPVGITLPVSGTDVGTIIRPDGVTACGTLVLPGGNHGSASFVMPRGRGVAHGVLKAPYGSLYLESTTSPTTTQVVLAAPDM